MNSKVLNKKPSRFKSVLDLAKKWDLSPSDLAHRYTLSVPGVSSVILGVKNRIELAECIKSEKNQLTDEEIAELEALYF